MKRIKSFLTIMMAAIFALSLVPAGAFAQATGDTNHGEMYGDAPYDGATSSAGEGVIKIANTKANETYSVYRILDLASFGDANTTPGNHEGSTHQTGGAYDGEAYSYVIREHTGDENADSPTANPWWTFLMDTDAANGTSEKYAQYKTTATGTATTATTNQLFWVERERITLTDAAGVSHSDYHVVTATDRFSNAWDVDAKGSSAEHAFPYDTQDYVTPGDGKSSIKVVQDFAQQALAYAEKTGITTAKYTETGSGGEVTVNSGLTNATRSDIANLGIGKVPLGYYLIGTTMGTLASLDTTNKSVTVYEKNQEPTLEKKVLKKGAKAGATGEADLVGKTLEAYKKSSNNSAATYATAPDEIDWVDNTDADVNDLVQFRSVITARQGVSDYRLHDSMEDGLSVLLQTHVVTRDQSGKVTGFETTGKDAAKPAETSTDEYKADDGTGAFNANAAGTLNLRVYLVRSGAAGTDEDPKVREILACQQDDNNAWHENWELKGAQADKCDFEVVFKDAEGDTNTVTGGDANNKVTFVDSNKKAVDVKDGDCIVVTYWARVLPTAVVYGTDTATHSGTNVTAVKGNDGNTLVDAAGTNNTEQKYTDTDNNNRNTNSTILTYGKKSHTEWRKAEVTTYQFDIVKTQASNTSVYNLLNGAQFRLYKATDDANDTAAIKDRSNADLNAAIGAGGLTVGSKTYYQTGKALVFDQPDASAPSYYRFVGDDLTGTNSGNAEPAGNHYPVSGTAADPGTILTSAYGKEINVKGLEEGWYLLVEEEAPEGFNKLAHPIAIYVNGDMDESGNLDYDGNNKYEDGTGSNVAPANQTTHEGHLNVCTTENSGAAVDGNAATKTYTAWDGAVSTDPVGGSGTTLSDKNPNTYTTGTNGGVHVINNTGQELPSTGGIGTTVFYVAGTVLVVGAAVMLVAKRRMGSEA